MRALRSWLVLLGTLALAGLPAPAGAQPVGSEFQVNTYTTGHQVTRFGCGHLIATDASGNFVVVWSSEGQDGSSHGIFGQRYDSGGVAQGAEFRVNSYTTSGQGNPSVAAAADGDFVVVWDSLYQDGDGWGIFGQRYDSEGVAQGEEFQVNSYTISEQLNPCVASDASGNFVVVWDNPGYNPAISGQRYNSAGMAQGEEFRVPYTVSYFESPPSVASGATGNFVVVWASDDGSFRGVVGQRYDSEGVPQGSEFRVNSYTLNSQSYPSVASDASGNFVVVWHSQYQDGSGNGIFGQRYDSAGGALGSEFRVNSHTLGGQFAPSVASDTIGNFVVAWVDEQQDGSGWGVFGQRYDSGGSAYGNEFRINTYTTSYEWLPSVGATGTNQFVAVWQSREQDGSDSGVFGQRFDFTGTQAITVVRPNTNVKWRIGSLQKVQWMHNLGADATFRIELNRDDNGDYEELIAADAPVDNATKGSFVWTVTGPRSGTARVRVSWTDDPAVSDASDVTFQIRPVGLD